MAHKQLIAVIDEPGSERDALAEAITCDGMWVYAADNIAHLPDETALIVAHARAVPRQQWSQLTHQLPTLVVSDSRQDADLIKAVDVGLVDYIVHPLRHAELLRRMIRKAIELDVLEKARARDHERLAELNESLETHLALLRMDQQSGGHIQRRLLPPRPKVINGVYYDYWFAPSLYLSGDFLDYQRYNSRYSAFYFADVSGHGASSAFVTVLLKYLCNRWLGEWDGIEPDKLPSQWLAAMNRELQGTDIGKHATLFVGVIDHEAHTLHYSLGAQLPMPLLVSGDQLTRLPGEGMPVGLFPDVDYPVLSCELPEDFRLWLCSDGVLECLPGDSLDTRLRELEQLVSVSTTLEQLCDRLTNNNALLSKQRAGDEDSPDRDALPDDLTIMMVSGFGHAD
ncbi:MULTISPECIES: PP2C family protein-serine/threonine phosphatase [Halomonadaceae]|jgi:serine phosphatase RsbU (regulator of sigma subunit)|uniref:SpoIIE family protein phosphatase n=1 Tax=Vreelandella janggokensis TaxID=370767 RepID=A0ABT4IPN4_9GAMM|nr:MULTISPECIES: fused response regulator/phosphatase [Halomonas]MCW4152347.1 SpoIIE family protein phosphatase [Halomonas sp. 18H]MCZ0925488.1 SpoIIE family protein phosphatase [Halomonas janggokensis]MCZ0931483.1 SpoIIE family protein phosphatase [Halomonas janggokensis]MDR5887001.1 SpoIIE family protein phosphatase [Halomonas janggokensis]QPL47466.1 SpoIIE family protein phosphatase [Halomonas sp. A40-4]